MNTFENGQIVVATKEQLTGCGLIKIHEGAIAMVANNKLDSYQEIKVWKSLDRYQCNEITNVNPERLRAATEEEQAMFFAGIRNINELKLNSND